jgi:hypothetical protein
VTIWISVLLVISYIRSFPDSWLITEIVTRVTQPVPLVEQEKGRGYCTKIIRVIFIIYIIKIEVSFCSIAQIIPNQAMNQEKTGYSL